jgi:hypothetical protein
MCLKIHLKIKKGLGRVLVVDFPIIFCEFYSLFPSKRNHFEGVEDMD